MAGNRPEERIPVPLVHQRWRHLTFLHWRYDAEDVERLLPPSLEPDIVDGSAWVTLTPFRAEDTHPPGLPPVPWVSTFPETNLRTYVRYTDGTDGLWFLSIDAASPPIVAGARAVAGAPYFPARMAVRTAGHLRYESRRLVGPPARHLIEVEPGEDITAELSERDELLIGRWRAYTRWLGRLLEVPVEHPPWPVRRAAVVRLEETHTVAAGLPAPAHEPVVHYSPGVDARLGVPRLPARRKN